MTTGTRSDVGAPHRPGADASLVHGICRSCSRRTFLWLPGRICEKCILRATAKAEQEAEIDFLNAMLEELEGDEDE